MRVIIDARGYGHHEMELLMGNGTAWILYRMAHEAQDLGHDVHVILDGYYEGVEKGIAYWPEGKYPHVCDVLITPGIPDQEIRTRGVIACRDLWMAPPGANRLKPQEVPGRLVWMPHANRGLWHLMGTWSYLKELHPDVSLVIGGNFPRYYEMMRWQHDYQGERVIDLKAWMDGDEAIEVRERMTRAEMELEVARAQIFAYPCDPIVPDTYHRSLSVTEAAAAGKALLLSPEETLAEDFEHAATFIEDAYDYETWAHTIANWIQNGGELRKHQKRAEKWANKHATWKEHRRAFGAQLKASIDTSE